MPCLRCTLSRAFQEVLLVPVQRPARTPEQAILLVAVWIALTGNHAFWRAILQGRDGLSPSTWGLVLAVGAALVAVHFLLPALIAPRRLLRPVLGLWLLVSALAGFYIDKFGIYIDASMIRNVLHTDVAEARELLTPDLFWHLAIFAGVPGWLLWRNVFPATDGWHAGWLRRGLWIVGVGLIGVAGLALAFKDLAPLMRNHKEIRYLVVPENAIYGIARNLQPNKVGTPLRKQPVGPDAKLGAAWQQRQRPALFVFVLGETARAANWGTHPGPDGQPRDTTPELDRKPLIRFADVTSCGTNTETSVPCIFSPQGRRHYDEDAIRNSESLLHVLNRAGFHIVWRDNQSGCKGVCSDLDSQAPDRQSLPQLCPDDHCLDEAMLAGMDKLLADDKGNLVVVLHQIGNHGPAYFRRYPESFRRFAPTCDTADLSQCTQAQIVNSYDNALLYTDHFLARTIDFLERQSDRFDTAMLYVSDHGESLGEHGLFLHGMPYAIAPREQTQVPMVLWLSDRFSQDFGVDRNCLAQRAQQPASHDNIFHSLLGLLDVSTQVYDASLDLSAACRG